MTPDQERALKIADTLYTGLFQIMSGTPLPLARAIAAEILRAEARGFREAVGALPHDFRIAWHLEAQAAELEQAK